MEAKVNTFLIKERKKKKKTLSFLFCFYLKSIKIVNIRSPMGISDKDLTLTPLAYLVDVGMLGKVEESRYD